MKKGKLFQLLGLEKLKEAVQGLVETKVAMVKAEIEDKISNTIAKLVPLILVFATFCMFLLFASVAVGFYLSQVLHSNFYGFGVVALFYIVLTILFYLLKDSKVLKRGVQDRLKD